MKHKRIFIPVLFILVVGLMALVIARSGSLRRRPPSPQIANPTFLQKQSRGGKEQGRARNLSLQPEAFRMGRRLGARFDSAKRETSVLHGTLTSGSELRNVQTKRAQTDEGEKVEIKVAGAAETLTWDAKQGSLSSGRRAGTSDRDLIERLVLDSPDQFVLAQLRGASYYVVARNVRPDNGGDDYRGPLWNIVRVNDPESDEAKRPQSRWRLYHINTATGLIDKIISEVQGQRIIAEFTWTNVQGEMVPAQVTWKRDGQLLMQYQLTSFEHSQTEGAK